MGYKESFQEIINFLLKKTKEHYGDNLVSFVIFGSVARGSFSPESDIDFMVICENLKGNRTERILDFIENIEKPVGEIIKKSGLNTELLPLIKTKKEVEYGSFLFLDMTEDSLILYDKGDFFKNYLERLKEKLKRYGARKVYKKGGYYWIIKPDLKPSEKIEI